MKSFEKGDKFQFSCWFTGGEQFCEVIDRTDDCLMFKVTAWEMDGISTRTEEADIYIDDDGNEYIVAESYRGEELRIYAKGE